MRWLTCMTAMVLSLSVYAQKPTAKPNPYAQIDAMALTLPDSSAETVDKIAGYINAHFNTPTEKARAIFIWIAYHIQYDVVNMFALNFYDDPAENIARPLHTRKGICVNYAALFTAICNQAGIRSLVVEGYTKQRGFVGYIPHAWCGAVIDGNWYLFDPTWGSGYVENNQFVRKLNESYFKATPETFIGTHMPFDPLWQFLYYPVTTEDFFNGKTAQDKSKPYFNYPDSLKVYEALADVDREAAAAYRIEKNGVRNSPTADMIRHLRADVENHKRQMEADRQNRIVDAFNVASHTYNNAVYQFNAFVNYYNTQFKPSKPDAEIQQMLDSADHQLQAAKTAAVAIVLTPADSRIQQPLQQLKDVMGQLEPRVRDMREWLAKYLSKGKLGRKSMFYKFSWMGIPLN
jgi:transglutaminase/protease-like cytokinesis protein 3